MDGEEPRSQEEGGGRLVLALGQYSRDHSGSSTFPALGSSLLFLGLPEELVYTELESKSVMQIGQNTKANR